MRRMLESAFKSCLALAILALPQLAAAQQGNKNSEPFTQDFRLEACTFSSTGRNPYFILEPGYRTIFQGEEAGETVVNTITVAGKTRRFGKVETRLVEERETHNGVLAEVSRNYFAICTQNNSVFYFGEEVDLYTAGVIVDHSGSWLAGVNGAKPGLVMPGIVLLGSRYFQEVAPGVAMDQAEFVAMDQVVTTPAGTFSKCVKSAETTPLEPKALEFKLYAPDIGLVQDDTLLLVQYGFVR
jgi:hypothetical protein